MNKTSLLSALLVMLLAGAALSQDSYKPPRVDLAQKLGGKTLSELRLLRNTVFALHGYDFKSEAMRQYFWNLSWYQKIRRSMEKKGEHFDPGSLSRDERRFVKRVKAGEQALLREAKRPGRPGQLYNYAIIENAAQFPEFDQRSRRLIEDNGFVVRPAAHEQFYSVYADNEYRMIPSFISSDSVLQLYHVFFDFSLRQIESEKLLRAASSLSRQLLARALATIKRTRLPEIRQAAELLAGYFGVAVSLFDGKNVKLPAAVRKKVAAELALIRKHSGRALSPLMGYKTDYSQFIPRGHYTRSAELKRYFLGMIWFGNIWFLPKRDDQLRAALLAAYYLEFYQTATKDFGSGPLKLLWDAIYEPTVFFVGESDDPTVRELRKASLEVFGKDVFKVRSFADDKQLERVRKILERLQRSRIRTANVDMPNQGIRFMGQRYIPDSEILQRLTNFERRPFPKGLDLFAVLGNQDARVLLDDFYKEPAKWDGYLPARRKLVREFAALPASAWRQNLYWSWLDCLRLLSAAPADGAPPFARTGAWRHKQLHTSLASWAELRHDTILYSKPFGAECGGGGPPPRVLGYVEPVPLFYARLRELLQQTRTGLDKYRILTDRFQNVAGQLDELLLFLERVSRKELARKTPSDGEYEQIRIFGSNLESLTLNLLTDFNYGGPINGPDRSVAVVADIGTVAGTALEEAVGTADEIFVVVEFAGRPTLTRGAVFSYYEFNWPAADRLTDEKWQSLRKKGKAPERPGWVEKFLVPESCPPMPNVFFYSSGC
jgi:hypothetical protein